jgi:hypothetical protein
MLCLAYWQAHLFRVLGVVFVDESGLDGGHR